MIEEIDDFHKLDFRVGTIVEVSDFPKARKKAYQLKIDFGNLKVLNSSAQITTQYSKEDLLGKQIVAIVNFKEKQIANFKSQCLVLGAVEDDDVFLLSPDALSIEKGTVVG